jgi:hypothetical protein
MLGVIVCVSVCAAQMENSHAPPGLRAREKLKPGARSFRSRRFAGI